MVAYVVVQLKADRCARGLIERRDFKQLCVDHS
jgi:hypothetical protein